MRNSHLIFLSLNTWNNNVLTLATLKKETNMILCAFGIPDYSSLQISEILRDLNVSHTLEGGLRHLTRQVYGSGIEQPAWPIVVDRVRAIPKIQTNIDRQILFICDCRAALLNTNTYRDLWPENRGSDIVVKFQNVLTRAVRATGWTLAISEPTTMEYVESATKPSYLNLAQSLLYKITPYSLRKEVQQLMVSYLAGIASYTALHKRLKSSLKLQALHELLSLPKAKELREAVLLLNMYSAEEVAKKTGFETFEILYLYSSSQKTMKGD